MMLLAGILPCKTKTDCMRWASGETSAHPAESGGRNDFVMPGNCRSFLQHCGDRAVFFLGQFHGVAHGGIIEGLAGRDLGRCSAGFVEAADPEPDFDASPD